MKKRIGVQSFPWEGSDEKEWGLLFCVYPDVGPTRTFLVLDAHTYDPLIWNRVAKGELSVVVKTDKGPGVIMQEGVFLEFRTLTSTRGTLDVFNLNLVGNRVKMLRSSVAPLLLKEIQKL
jgi:hypothetical protein